MRKMSNKCCVPSCPGTGKVLHRFPIPGWESVLIQEWVSRIASVQLFGQSENRLYTFYRVCDLHFSEHCRVSDKTRLKKGSVPTLLVPGFKGPSNAQTSILESSLKQLNTKKDIYIEESQNKNIEKENYPELPVKKPSFFVSVKTISPYDRELQEVCRICFKSVDEDNYITLCEDRKEIEQFKEMLTKVLPELDQKMYPGIVICSLCENLIVSSYKLKEMCSDTGEKLKQIIEKEEYTLTYNGILVITELTPHMKILMDHNYAQNRVLIKNEIVSNENKNPPSLFYHTKLKTGKFGREKIWGRGPYLCDKCGFSSARIAAFRYHLVKHSGRQPQAPARQALCELCGKVCMNVYSLNKHLRRHKKNHKCSHCGKVFLTIRMLQTHYKTTHGAFQQCKFCAQVVKRGKSLTTHMLIHKYEKN